jgi:hypothetical protein
MTALARTSSKYPLVRVFSWKIRLLVVGLKGLVAKTN